MPGYIKKASGGIRAALGPDSLCDPKPHFDRTFDVQNHFCKLPQKYQCEKPPKISKILEIGVQRLDL